MHWIANGATQLCDSLQNGEEHSPLASLRWNAMSIWLARKQRFTARLHPVAFAYEPIRNVWGIAGLRERRLDPVICDAGMVLREVYVGRCVVARLRVFGLRMCMDSRYRFSVAETFSYRLAGRCA